MQVVYLLILSSLFYSSNLYCSEKSSSKADKILDEIQKGTITKLSPSQGGEIIDQYYQNWMTFAKHCELDEQKLKHNMTTLDSMNKANLMRKVLEYTSTKLQCLLDAWDEIKQKMNATSSHSFKQVADFITNGNNAETDPISQPPGIKIILDNREKLVENLKVSEIYQIREDLFSLWEAFAKSCEIDINYLKKGLYLFNENDPETLMGVLMSTLKNARKKVDCLAKVIDNPSEFIQSAPRTCCHCGATLPK